MQGTLPLSLVRDCRRFGGRNVPRVIGEIDRAAAAQFADFFAERVPHAETRRRQATAICEFCEWTDRRLHSVFALQPVTVSIYLEQIRERKPLEAARNAWSALRVFFDWFVERDLLATNPARAVPDPGLGLDWPEPTAGASSVTCGVEVGADATENF